MAGLFNKYRVYRLGDSDGKHRNCRYFVLDPQHDPIARKALSAYADLAEDDFPELSLDLNDWLQQLNS